MVSFLLHAGLRFQESLSLGLGDVQLSERKGSLLVRHGKGNKEQEIRLTLKRAAHLIPG